MSPWRHARTPAHEFHAAAPRIRAFGFPPNLKAGERIVALCTPSQGSRPFRFAWQKDGRNLEQRPDVQVFVQADVSSSIVFESLRLQDAGNYSCIVSNDFGSDKFTASLAVKCESLLLPFAYFASPVHL